MVTTRARSILGSLPAGLPAGLLAAPLAAALLACASLGVPPAPVAPAPAIFETQEFALGDGLLLVTVKTPHVPRGPKPVVIQPLLDDEELLARGFVVARFRHDFTNVLDALPAANATSEPRPKNAVGSWLLTAPRAGIVGRAYFQVIRATARESVPRVIDLLETLPEVDPKRIAIAGSSTGGFIALEAMIAEPRLAAGVVRVTCGDYHGFLRSSSLALADDPRWLPDGALKLDADYEIELAAQEPIQHAASFPPRPLLMLNGATDPGIPLACAVRTAELLQAAYAAAAVPERFRFVVYEGEGHDLGHTTDEETLGWWERWLSR